MPNSASNTVLIAHPSADLYGADLQLLESVSALVAEGWRVVVAVPGAGPLVDRLEERGAEVGYVAFPVLRRANASPIGVVRMAGQATAALPRLLRVISRFNPAAIYVNTVTLPWWLLAGRLSRRPTIVHVHEAERGDNALVLRALLRPLRLAELIVAISRSTLASIAEADPTLASRARLVYNGVAQPPAEPVAARRGRPIRLVVIGRLSPRKAPHLALEVTAGLRQRGYDAALEVAGTAYAGYDWYERGLVERAGRSDLTGAVTFSGYSSPIWPVLDRSDILLAPSLREPFGNAVVEAQLARRPVVAAAAFGHTETVVDGVSGLLVPPEDVDAMVGAVARLVDDAALAERLAVEGRRSALRRFSLERYRREIVGLVDDVVGGARPNALWSN